MITVIVFLLSACLSSFPVTATPSYELLVQQPEPSSAMLKPTATLTQSVPATPAPEKLSEEWLLWNDSSHKSAVRSVSCGVCHKKDEISKAEGNELCKGCHTTAGKISAQDDSKKIVHTGFTCLDCHNPHSARASCSNAGCHAGIRKPGDMPPATPVSGHPNVSAFCGGGNCHPAATQAALANPGIHGARHAGVSCIACHDASGLQAGPSKETGLWELFQTIDDEGILKTKPFISHTLQASVACSRCHYEGNVWGLPLVHGKEFGN